MPRGRALENFQLAYDRTGFVPVEAPDVFADAVLEAVSLADR
ncbi:MAG: hypothetical protein QOG60_1716 [Frankiaceae bacterium]|nr:hypothetical protein [Frankiaceae bacterium]